VLGFLAGEALRDLRRGGRTAVSAIVLIALSLGALGAFGLLSSNLGRAVGEWRDRVRIIVYLSREPADASALVRRVQAIPGVSAARYVDRTQALASLKRTLGKDAAVVDQLPANPLPASIEVTPAAPAATSAGARALLDRLARLPEADEVAGGIEWGERLAHWQRLLQSIGLVVGGLLAVAAILTVTTATTLVLHVRRDETEIMRLVGAPEYVIRLPLLMQGALQGLVGALAAVLVLGVAHRLLAPHLMPLVTVTLGLPGVTFLPPIVLAGLVLGGTMLGGLGGLLARRRGQA
jgi:cell division transport system permease protein